ncbi:C2 domain protein (macronuclear) [Tetrahymena thermophila SB210]|uniref:C2 domain protein n=1 Tax=Tetrahymena thermophila (strain SB210) TaxID=312017 RepID=Q23DC0_TETTS|nr:C2 domain protein [Tetrahymena thermophila SB210]EAR94653.2 C2 domain protein [Tetrahymena thermophila SB210]|eukprot:XP_001014766.2 C2 domain protein [Tetrahymena thermophila SB210]
MQSVSGKLQIQLIGAQLTRDVKLIGSMNPYVVFRFGDIKKTSAVNEGGGKNPKWCDKIDFQKIKETKINIDVYNMRKLGLFDNDLICSGTLDLCKFTQQYQGYEAIPLYHGSSSAGTLNIQVTFTPDVQQVYQFGQIILQGEAPLDITLRVVSALLTRDTQWFGSMCCYYVATCGDKKHTSTLCNSGKTPQWSDKFNIAKKSDQKFNIEIINQNNKTCVATCVVPHEVLANYQPGVRTLPLSYQGTPAGQLFLEVTYNSYPGDMVAPIYQPLQDYCPEYYDVCPASIPQYPPQQPQYPPQQPQYPPQQPQYPPYQPQYPSQEVQYPPQEVQYPPQEVQYPPQQPQYPPQQSCYAPQYPPAPQDQCSNPYGHYPNLQQQYPQYPPPPPPQY